MRVNTVCCTYDWTRTNTTTKTPAKALCLLCTQRQRQLPGIYAGAALGSQTKQISHPLSAGSHTHTHTQRGQQIIHTRAHANQRNQNKKTHARAGPGLDNQKQRGDSSAKHEANVLYECTARMRIITITLGPFQTHSRTHTLAHTRAIRAETTEAESCLSDSERTQNTVSQSTVCGTPECVVNRAQSVKKVLLCCAAAHRESARGSLSAAFQCLCAFALAFRGRRGCALGSASSTAAMHGVELIISQSTFVHIKHRITAGQIIPNRR